MATRLKTITYAFPTYTSLVADAVVTNLNQITLYIPEANPTFVSVTVDVGFQDVITATGGTIAEHRCGLRLGASAYTTITETGLITHSGENMGGILGPFDFTSHFSSNWSGTSMTCDLQVFFDQSSGTTLGMRNVTAEITITYQYDDTAATQIKTVYIPLESVEGALPTVANSNMGTNQIPQLTGTGGMLPENSVVIRDYYFLIEGNTSNNNANTDFTLRANIDSGTAFAFGINEAALASDYYTRWIYKPSVPDTSVAHNFQLWSSVANKTTHPSVTLVVTYQFNLSGTTNMLNSIILPFEMASPLGIDTSAEASRFSRQFFVPENNVTLKQSAFRIHFNTTATVAGLSWRSGGQNFRAYTHLATVVCGMFVLQQRIDSGSSQGAGLTLSRGINTLTIDGYATDTTDQVNNISGYAIINYTSSVPSQGIGAATHTITKVLAPWASTALDRLRAEGYSINIPETSYWLTSVGFIVNTWLQAAANGISFNVEVLSGESSGAGYKDIYTDVMQNDNERQNVMIWMRGMDVFKTNPNDPNTSRLDIETARDYRWFSATTTSGIGILNLITYHAITYSTTINITNSSGGTVYVELFRADTDEKILETSRVGNGSVTLTWYDNTLDVYVVCYENSSRLGRSANFKMGD